MNLTSFEKFTNIELDQVKECLLNHESSTSWPDIFENNFRNYIGCKYAIACNSGTSGLHMCLNLIGVGKGDEVILPAQTFLASASVNCISLASLNVHLYSFMIFLMH